MDVAGKDYYPGQGPVNGNYFPPRYPNVGPPRYPGIPPMGYPGNPPMRYPGNIPPMYPGMWNPYFNIRAGIPPYPPHMQINPQHHQETQYPQKQHPGQQFNRQNPNGMGNSVNIPHKTVTIGNVVNNPDTKSKHSENGKRKAEKSPDNFPTSFGKRRKSEWEDDETLPKNWKKRSFQTRHPGTSTGMATMFEFLSPNNEIFESRRKMVKHLKEDGQYTQDEIDMAQHSRMRNGVNQMTKKFLKNNSTVPKANIFPNNVIVKTETETDVEKIYCQYCEMEFTDFDLWRVHEEEEYRMSVASEAMVNPNQMILETFQERPNFQQNPHQPVGYPQINLQVNQPNVQEKKKEGGVNLPDQFLSKNKNIVLTKVENPTAAIPNQNNPGNFTTQNGVKSSAAESKKYKTLQDLKFAHHGSNCSEWVTDPSLPFGWKKRSYQNNNRNTKTGKMTKYQYLSPNDEIVPSRCQVMEYMRESGMYSEEDIIQVQEGGKRKTHISSKVMNLNVDGKSLNEDNDFGFPNDDFKNTTTPHTSNESTPNLINHTDFSDDNFLNNTEVSGNNNGEEKYLSYKKITKDIFGAFSNYIVNSTDISSDDLTNSINLSSNESTDSAYMSLVEDFTQSSDISRPDDLASNEILNTSDRSFINQSIDESMAATEESDMDLENCAIFGDAFMESSKQITKSIDESYSVNTIARSNDYILTHSINGSNDYSSSSNESPSAYIVASKVGIATSSDERSDNSKDGLTYNGVESGCLNNISETADIYMNDNEEWDEETNNDYLNNTIVSSMLYITEFEKDTTFEDSTNDKEIGDIYNSDNDCNGNYIELKNAGKNLKRNIEIKMIRFNNSQKSSFEHFHTPFAISEDCNTIFKSYEGPNDLNHCLDSKLGESTELNSEESNDLNITSKCVEQSAFRAPIENFEKSGDDLTEETNYDSVSFENIDGCKDSRITLNNSVDDMNTDSEDTDFTNTCSEDSEKLYDLGDSFGNDEDLNHLNVSRENSIESSEFNVSLEKSETNNSSSVSFENSDETGPELHQDTNISEQSYEGSNDLNFSFEDSKTSKEPFALNVCIENSEESNNSNVSVQCLENFEESDDVTDALKNSEESNYTSASYEDLNDLNSTCETSSVSSDENPVELNKDITNSYELTQFPKFIGPLVSMNIDDFSILSVLFAKNPNPSKSIMDDISEDMEIPPKDLKWIFIKLRDMFKTKKGQLLDPKPIEDLVELMRTTYGENSFSV